MLERAGTGGPHGGDLYAVYGADQLYFWQAEQLAQRSLGVRVHEVYRVDAVEYYNYLFFVMSGVLCQAFPVLFQLIFHNYFTRFVKDLNRLQEFTEIVVHFLIGDALPIPINLPDIMITQIVFHQVSHIINLRAKPIDTNIAISQSKRIQQLLRDISLRLLTLHPLLHNFDKFPILLRCIVSHQGNGIGIGLRLDVFVVFGLLFGLEMGVHAEGVFFGLFFLWVFFCFV